MAPFKSRSRCQLIETLPNSWLSLIRYHQVIDIILFTGNLCDWNLGLKDSYCKWLSDTHTFVYKAWLNRRMILFHFKLTRVMFTLYLLRIFVPVVAATTTGDALQKVISTFTDEIDSGCSLMVFTDAYHRSLVTHRVLPYRPRTVLTVDDHEVMNFIFVCETNNNLSFFIRGS